MSFNIAFYQITQEAVQFDPGVIWSGQATTAETATQNTEIASILLYENISGYFRCAKEAVLALVDGKLLRNSSTVRDIIIFPAHLKLAQRDTVGSIAIDFV